jgi:hypothetical protein
MPRIELKPNSPEYDDGVQASQKMRKCDISHCACDGEFRAPKSRGLNDYYNFCLDHVREYNKSWNFFKGMASREVEEHMLRSLYGDRPTWRNDHGPELHEKVFRKAWQAYNYTDSDPDFQPNGNGGVFHAYHHDSPEYKAMALMGLEPPLSLELIKKRYKELAKKHHPDHNPDCDKSEDLLKEVNIAYTVLKTAFEKYEKLNKDG